MYFSDLIELKQNNRSLTRGQITRFVKDYTSGKFSDATVLPLLRAIYEHGMDPSETYYLANSMAKSGKMFKFPKRMGLVVDKHSTGGVGDKVSPAFAAVVAAANAGGDVQIRVGKVSGKALGHTGGTVDKLKSINGFRVDLTEKEFLHTLQQVGIAIIGQTTEMVPADKKIYALRDKSGLIDSIPLIASSVMSKKIAAGAKFLVLDVKAGNGAFMKDVKAALKLARAMLDISKRAGIKAAAVITSMDQPLGDAIGNRIEIAEVKQLLTGRGPDDLKKITLELSFEALRMCGAKMSKQAITILIDRGEALLKLREWMICQGSEPEFFDRLDMGSIRKKVRTEKIVSARSGYVSSVDTQLIGEAARMLKGKNDADYDAGIIIHKKIGEKAVKGEILLELLAKDVRRLNEAAIILESSIGITRNEVSSPKLIYKVLRNYP